ncbi:MAG: DUF2950 domain-containing protein [Deltaproteobacteria bacterium]|nr:DUF2950 domain-containing protein [Deltaproteobacteria bacterium]
MKLSLIREQAGTPGWLLTLTRLALIFTAVFLSLPAFAATTKQKTFTSPEKAVQELVASLKKADRAAVIAVLGPNSEQLISSGDPVADRHTRERFLSAYDEKQRLDREGKSKAVLVIGKNDWPFPIPIVKNKNLWRFDSRAGAQEIINRRIGANELDTIQTCLAFIDAQLEYAMEDYDGDGLLEYAAKFWSDPGKKNGLYWQTGEGEPPSPLGELFARAKSEGYTIKERPSPYHGYLYRILTGQGKHAEGGAYDYMVNGNLLGGVALIAVPAQYGASGVMTFIINHDGVVYQKDLGRKTVEIASEIKLFDPGPDWKKVEMPAVK